MSARANGLTIQGAGIGQTVLIDGVSKATYPNIPQMFSWSVPDTGLSRMTGITWRGGGVVDPNNSGMIQIDGGAAQFRMDHNEFKPNGTKAVTVFGYVRGVIDHNIFRCLEWQRVRPLYPPPDVESPRE
jgi:hypothetical protein